MYVVDERGIFFIIYMQSCNIIVVHNVDFIAPICAACVLQMHWLQRLLEITQEIVLFALDSQLIDLSALLITLNELKRKGENQYS